jgi:hypothetical protein
MKNLIIAIYILSINLMSCNKEPLTAPEIKYKHPVAPDKIPNEAMQPTLLTL